MNILVVSITKSDRHLIAENYYTDERTRNIQTPLQNLLSSLLAIEVQELF
jgi:hypothetical protein